MIVSGFPDGLPPRWLGSGFMLVGFAVVCAAAVSGPRGWDQTEYGPAALGSIFFGVLFLIIGGALHSTRSRLRQLMTVDQLAAHLGTSDSSLDAFISETEVRPRYLVNGREFFAPVDFARYHGLLRPAEAPPVLLRPAVQNEESRSVLLRSSATLPEITGSTANTTGEEVVICS